MNGARQKGDSRHRHRTCGSREIDKPMSPTPHTSKDPVSDTLAVYAARSEQFADRWDTFDPARDASIDLVVQAVRGMPTSARVLDVGCGSGRDLQRLRDLGYDATGVDASPELAARASMHAPVLLADMRHLPLKDGTFDVILAAASLLHLPLEDAKVAMAEFARVVRPGGRVVVSVKAGDGPVIAPDGRFFHLYTNDLLDEVLMSAGFDVTTRVEESDAGGTTWLVRIATR